MSLRFRVARSITLSLMLGLGAATAGGPAFAQDAAPSRNNIEEAKRHFQRGRELYEENNFQAALVELRRAYELAPTYRLHFDIGQVYYQLQDYPNALKSFTRFLQEGKAEIPAEKRDEVQREIDKLKGRVATLRVTTSHLEAEVSIDDVPVGKTPLAEPILVSPGRRKITATLKGYAPTTKTVEIAGQDTLDVSLDLVALSPDGAEAGGGAGAGPRQTTGPGDSGGQGGSSVAPIVGWVATGVFAVTAGVFGGLALSSSGELKERRESFGATRKELDDLQGKTKTFALVSDVALGVTAVAAGVSIYLTVSSSGSGKSTGAAAPLRVGIGPGRLDLAGTF